MTLQGRAICSRGCRIVEIEVVAVRNDSMHKEEKTKERRRGGASVFNRAVAVTVSTVKVFNGTGEFAGRLRATSKLCSKKSNGPTSLSG